MKAFKQYLKERVDPNAPSDYDTFRSQYKWDTDIPTGPEPGSQAWADNIAKEHEGLPKHKYTPTDLTGKEVPWWNLDQYSIDLGLPKLSVDGFPLLDDDDPNSGVRWQDHPHYKDEVTGVEVIKTINEPIEVESGGGIGSGSIFDIIGHKDVSGVEVIKTVDEPIEVEPIEVESGGVIQNPTGIDIQTIIGFRPSVFGGPKWAP